MTARSIFGQYNYADGQSYLMQRYMPIIDSIMTIGKFAHIHSTLAFSNTPMPAGVLNIPCVTIVKHKQIFTNLFIKRFAQDGYYSSDYRLSPYGALSFRVKLAETIGDWTVSLSAERYISDKSYSLQSVDVENPGLVDFTLFTFGVDYIF